MERLLGNLEERLGLLVCERRALAPSCSRLADCESGWSIGGGIEGQMALSCKDGIGAGGAILEIGNDLYTAGIQSLSNVF